MTGRVWYDVFVVVWLALALFIFVASLFLRPPQARQRREGSGGMVEDRWAWILMELPAVLVFGLFFVFRKGPNQPLDWVWLFLWEGHYLYRDLLYPQRRRSVGNTTPRSIVIMGAVFNVVNGCLNGYYIFRFRPGYGVEWLLGARFVIGVAMMLLGFAMHSWTDNHLRGLRPARSNEYAVPEAGLFRWVTCPNYLGEIVEWCGWAVATWSLPGLSFALWTAANLSPRAMERHLWYHEQFDDYPMERKALIPGLW